MNGGSSVLDTTCSKLYKANVKRNCLNMHSSEESSLTFRIGPLLIFAACMIIESIYIGSMFYYSDRLLGACPSFPGAPSKGRPFTLD
jgi:hypothetical protein